MAKGTLYKLAIELTMSNASLEKETKKGKQSINSLKESIGELAKVGASIAALGGTFKFLVDSISKVEGPGDRFEAKMAGGKEAVFELQRTITTLDFSNLVTNLEEAYKRGKEVNEALDRLADIKGFTDWKIAGMENEVSNLTESLKNKTLDLKTRSDIADRILKIEGDIRDRTIEIGNETYETQKKQWENRNKMTVDAASTLYENLKNIETNGFAGSDGIVKISKENIEKLENYFDDYVEAEETAGKSAKNAIKGAGEMMKANLLGGDSKSLISSLDKSTLELFVDLYTKFSLLNEVGERDVWPKLFELLTTKINAATQAQDGYNTAVSKTTALMAREDKQEDKANKTDNNTSKSLYSKLPSKSNDAYNKLTAKSDWLTTPSNGKYELNRMGDVFDDVDKKEKKFYDDFMNNNDLMTTGINRLGDAFQSLGDIIGGATGSVVSFVGQAISSFASLGSQYVQLYAQAFGTGAMEALSSGARLPFPYNLVAMGTALASFMSLAASIPKLADGGIAYGNSIVNVGEYSGARTNPEVIAPLSKLKDIISVGNGSGSVDFRIKGDDLVSIHNKRIKARSKY